MANIHHARSSSAVLATALLALGGPVAGQAGDGKLTDAEIAHVAVTANAIDVEMGELARHRASDERVRRFAATMIADHSAVNEQAAALAKRLGLTPADNGVSRSLSSAAAEAKAKLERAGEAGFDEAYMAREVDYHRAVLGALDETLIPGAQNAELRTLLEQARAAVAAHLEHAEQLQASLAGR